MPGSRAAAPIFPCLHAALAATAALAVPLAPLAAQELGQRPLEDAPAPAPAPETDAAGNRQVAFEADQLSYDETGEAMTATGNVVLRSGDRSVRADKVTYNRQGGRIVATGRVRFVDENGNQLFTESVELTDKFEAGTMEDLLIALREGGRLAARSGARASDGSIALSDAAYSACPVETPQGCPKDPTWRITANRVAYDPANAKVRFSGAVLEIFGLRLLPLPALTINTSGGAQSGFTIPVIQLTRNNGIQVSQGYYWRLRPDMDLSASGTVFTRAPPMVDAQFRHLTDRGAYQVTGYLTASKRVPDPTEPTSGERDLRGYLFTNGSFQLGPHWRLTGSARLASDRTFLRRYDISYDDRLRSTVNLERIDDSSYLSVAGWYTQTLRPFAVQGQVPVALPAIDYRKRLASPVLGGTLEFQGNTLVLGRAAGQDTRRAFGSARWDLRRITPLGQVVQFTALARGDLYNSQANALTPTASYRGNPGWQSRGVALAAVEVSWPLMGSFLGGTQVLTPRVQLVAAPSIRNLIVPNEDSRAIDLEDTNLFELNRFPGYDRLEDGVRATYGLDWRLAFPGLEIQSSIGQSYRFKGSRDILVDGTGIFDDVSDIVGRTQVKFRDFVRFTHRYRLDKDNFAVRRNEIDATIGTSRTYLEFGYLRLDRDIQAVEDLQDREEARIAGRIAFANYWSAFGSAVFNLTDSEEDPTLTSNGFQPLRTRFGVAYADECLEIGVSWRRDSFNTPDFRRGNTFQFYFALRNLGFR